MLSRPINKFFSQLKIDLKGSKVLLCVSGGVDSMVQLHYFSQNFPKTHFAVAHVNHNLRPSSKADYQLVKQVCDQLNVSLFSTELDPKEISGGQSHEMWGREQRYHFFSQITQSEKMDWVLTAHHKNDQIETLFQRIGRGSGLKGLQGILHWRKPNILRPMIDISKTKILEYAKTHKLKWTEDETNQNLEMDRNWVRHRYIPPLIHSEPKLEESINKITSEMQGLIPRFRKLLFQKLKWSRDYQQLVLPLNEFDRDEGPLDAFLKLQIFLEIHGCNLSEGHFDELSKQFQNEGVGVSLFQNKTLRCDRNCLWVELESEEKGIQPKEVVFDLNWEVFDHKVAFEGNWYGRCYTLYVRKYSRGGKFEIQKEKGWRALFDAEQFSKPLSIRNWRPGDRFAPLGTPSCTRKLKDYFIGIKMPMSKKNEQLLVCDGDRIAWLPTLEISDDYKVRENTKHILELEIQWRK